jgi:hypothetical protein
MSIKAHAGYVGGVCLLQDLGRKNVSVFVEVPCVRGASQRVNKGIEVSYAGIALFAPWNLQSRDRVSCPV